VSYRVLEKEAKILGKGLKNKAQAEEGFDGSSEEGKPATKTEGTGGSKPPEPPLGGESMDAAEKGSGDKVQKKGEMTPEKQRFIDQIFSTKRFSVPPSSLKESEKGVRDFFKNDIANVEKHIKEKNLSRFPESLLKVLAESEDYNVTAVSFVWEEDRIGMVKTISNRPGNYNRLNKQSQISLWAIAEDDGSLEEEITHILDHILGSNTEEIDGTLSAGKGITKRLEEFGKEIDTLYKDKSNDLGTYASINPREFLGQAVRYNLKFPTLLQEICPSVYNVVENKWFNEDFWKEVFE